MRNWIAPEDPTGFIQRLEAAGPEIALTDVLPGGWERLVVFGPYLDAATVRATLCFDWSSASDLSEALAGEDRYALVLLDKGAVTEWMIFRSDASHSPVVIFQPPFPITLSRSSAVFGVDSIGDELTLRPAKPLDAVTCPPRGAVNHTVRVVVPPFFHSV